MADTDAPTSIWMYDPSLALACLATALYAAVFVAIFYLTVVKYRAWFFTCVVFGAAVEVAGYATRIYSIKNPLEISPFVVTLSLTVLAPIFVAAGNYLLIGRLIRAVLPAGQHAILGVPARWLTRLFVLCDVLSFLVQGSGSAIASSANWVGPNEVTGVRVLITGLALQVATFGVFFAILLRFHTLAGRAEAVGAPVGWRGLLAGIYVSSGLIMLRSIYRVIEFAAGVDGYPFRHEWIFWVFEALPMLIAIAIFCIYHPSKYLGKDGGKGYIADEETSGELSDMRAR